MQDCLLTKTNLSFRVSTCLAGLMLQSLFSLVFAAVMWVQYRSGPMTGLNAQWMHLTWIATGTLWLLTIPSAKGSAGTTHLGSARKAFKMSPT